MLIGTFGPTTGWDGKTVSGDGGSFVLEDQGELRGIDLVCYWQQGHMTWASHEACVYAVNAANVALAADLRAFAKHWKSVQDSLVRAENHGRAKLATVSSRGGQVILYEDRIETSQGSSWLSPAVSATVDTAGQLTVQRRATLTRVAAGGLLAGPLGMLAGGMLKKQAKSDDRELYLLIETPDFVGLFPCDPKRAASVRQFTAQLATAVLRQPQLAQERSILVAQANEALRSAQIAGDELERARGALSQAQAALQAPASG